MQELQRFISVKTAAEILDVSPDTVRRRFKQYLVQLSARRVGLPLHVLPKAEGPPMA
jgi:hypothetical protein